MSLSIEQKQDISTLLKQKIRDKIEGYLSDKAVLEIDQIMLELKATKKQASVSEEDHTRNY
ncbi:MAG TPA: hypothetical protein EYP22_06685 [Methanosarcinales archaeon]|nr:hypothetical protein [Methanosarcinales archaeon]